MGADTRDILDWNGLRWGLIRGGRELGHQIGLGWISEVDSSLGGCRGWEDISCDIRDRLDWVGSDWISEVDSSLGGCWG